jgi:peroxiredoxin family protein
MDPMIAAILSSGELERVSTALSLLVSAAADGREARGLATYGALGVLLDDALLERASVPAAAPHVTDAGRAAFARTLVELRDTAASLEPLRIWACAAAVEATGASREAIDARLAGVMSTPRFLREVAGAELVVV